MEQISFVQLFLISEFIIGFFVALTVIRNDDRKIVWKTLNRGQEVSAKVWNNTVLTVFVLTIIGVFSLIIYYAAKKKYKEN